MKRLESVHFKRVSIEADKIKLSNDQKSDKKLGIKKQQVTKKTTRKKTVVKTKSKK